MSQWQGTKVERKRVEERAASRELTDMARAGDVYPNTSIHHVCAALTCYIDFSPYTRSVFAVHKSAIAHVHEVEQTKSNVIVEPVGV